MEHVNSVVKNIKCQMVEKKKSSALISAEWNGGMNINIWWTKNLLIKSNVLVVKRSLYFMVIKEESTAQCNAIRGLVMVKDSKAHRQNQEQYLISFLQAKRMNEMGIISNEDLIKIEEKLREKYCIKITSLYVGIDWISTPFRGNMWHTKGGIIWR